MKKRYFISIQLIFVLLAITVAGKAQSYISFGANGKLFGMPVSQYVNGYASCNVWLKNCGPSNVTISGFLTTYVDTSTGLSLFQRDTIFPTTINSGDSILFSFSPYFKSTRCRIGNNILVIWPSLFLGNNLVSGCGDTLAVDSIIILGGGTLNTKDPFNTLSLPKLFPNPIRDKMQIDFSPGEPRPEYISILDVSGREWMLMPYATSFDISSLDNGVYYIRLLYSDKRSVVMRIVKVE